MKSLIKSRPNIFLTLLRKILGNTPYCGNLNTTTKYSKHTRNQRRHTNMVYTIISGNHRLTGKCVRHEVTHTEIVQSFGRQ